MIEQVYVTFIVFTFVSLITFIVGVTLRAIILMIHQWAREVEGVHIPSFTLHHFTKGILGERIDNFQYKKKPNEVVWMLVTLDHTLMNILSFLFIGTFAACIMALAWPLTYIVGIILLYAIIYKSFVVNTSK